MYEKRNYPLTGNPPISFCQFQFNFSIYVVSNLSIYPPHCNKMEFSPIWNEAASRSDKEESTAVIKWLLSQL